MIERRFPRGQAYDLSLITEESPLVLQTLGRFWTECYPELVQTNEGSIQPESGSLLSLPNLEGLFEVKALREKLARMQRDGGGRAKSFHTLGRQDVDLFTTYDSATLIVKLTNNKKDKVVKTSYQTFSERSPRSEWVGINYKYLGHSEHTLALMTNLDGTYKLYASGYPEGANERMKLIRRFRS